MVKKISKIAICCLTIIFCVSCCFIPFVSSASPPPITSELTAVPYCPSLYYVYRPVGDTLPGSNVVGGYASRYRLLKGSRNSFLMGTRYLDAGGSYSFFEDDVTFTSFGMSDSSSRYYNTDSIIYGVSSRYIQDDTSFFYMPFYNIKDFGLSLYVSASYNSNLKNVRHVPASSIADMHTDDLVYIRVVYKRGDGSQGVYELNDYSFLTSFYVNNPSGQDFQSMRTYLLKNDPSFTEDSTFYSLTIIYTYDPSNDPYNSSLTHYVNALIAIGDADSYIVQRDYFNGIKSFGYELGVRDTSEFNDTGVFGLISSSVAGFLMFEIWNGFTIGHMLMICISVPLFVWIVKLLAGG